MPARRHPHQVFLSLLCILAGLPILFGGPRPGSLSAALPGWLLAVWSVTLVTGGSFLIAAAVTRSIIRALYLEAVAHLPLAFMTLAYASALLGVIGVPAWSSALIVLAFGCASAVRAFQVARTLRGLTRAVRKQVGET